MKFVEDCRRLISLESTPDQGNRRVAETLAEMARQAGLDVQLQQETLKGLEQANVIIRPPGAKTLLGSCKEFLLQTHLDTAEPGSFALWTQTEHNPFNASIYGDTLYGLGAADTKLDFLCKLEALKSLAGENFKKPPVIVGTFGAQTGMTGASKLLRRQLIDPDLALVGEPTDFALSTKGIGLAVVEISIPFSPQERDYRRNHDLVESSFSQSKIFFGKPAHGSVPEMGENAILKMLDYLSQLPQGLAVMDLDGGISHNSVPASAVLEVDLVGGMQDPLAAKIRDLLAELRGLEQEFRLYQDDNFYPKHPTMNLGMIRTSEDQVQLTGSCRILPMVEQATYEGWMESLDQFCRKQNAQFRVLDYKPSFSTDPQLPFVQACSHILEEMGLSALPRGLAAATEASVFSRMGISCVAFGPGKSAGNSHQPNESISLDSLQKATQFYRRIIQRMCL